MNSLLLKISKVGITIANLKEDVTMIPFSKKKTFFILLLLFLLLISLVSTTQAIIPEMNGSVNITYIGINETNRFGDETNSFGEINSLAIEVLMEDYLSPEKDYLNRKGTTNAMRPVYNHPDSQIYHVNYHYINGYEPYDTSEFKVFSAPGGDIEFQDIVIIDMYWVYENQDLLNNLKAAKIVNPNLKIIQIRSNEFDLDGIFFSQEDAELITLIEANYMTFNFWNDSSTEVYRTYLASTEENWTRDVPASITRNYPTRSSFYYEYVLGQGMLINEIEGASLTMRIISHVLKEYAPPEKIDEMNFEKTKILYVGYDAGTAATNYSGILTFDTLKDIVENSIYNGYIEIDTVSFGSVPNSSSNVYPQLQDDSWYSPAILYTNMDERGIQFADYDVILFDGFFTVEIIDMFSNVFDNASGAGAELVFNTQYLNTPTGPSVATIANSNFPTGSFFFSSNYIVMSSRSASFNQLLLNIKNMLRDNQIGTPFSSQNFIYSSSRSTLEFGGYFYHIDKIKTNTIEKYMDLHEKSAYHNPGKPYIVLFGFSTYRTSIERLSQLIESQGYNTVLIVTDGFDFYANMDQYLNKTKSNSTPSDIAAGRYIVSMISFKNWALDYNNQANGVYNLEQIGVPVIKAVGAAAGDAIYDTGSGVSSQNFAWMGSSSNLEGMIDFIAISSQKIHEKNLDWVGDRAVAWAKLSETSNQDKQVALMYYNYPPGKEDIGANYLNVMRSLAGDGAKQYVASIAKNPSDIGNYVSYPGIIREMRSEGYNVQLNRLPVVTIGSGGEHIFDYTVTDEALILNEVNLINLIYTQGINVGSYAPGVLDTMVQERIDYINDANMSHTADTWWGCELIPVTDYIKWVEHEIYVNETMNISLFDEAVNVWGIPQGFGPIDDDTYWGGMIWTDKQNQLGYGQDRNYIVVPMIKFGNVRIMPEPNRALASDTALSSANYHGDLPPTHQYIATYFWLNRGTGDSTGTGETGFTDGDRGWKADALIHFGTHGTQEWLPGTSLGLSRADDWGPVLLPDLPNIYPYIVANVGEGLTAEYRGNALIISHMTPPMIKTQLYDDLIEMETAIRGYQKNVAAGGGVEELLAAYRFIIVTDVYKFGWNDAFTDVFGKYKNQIVADSDYPGRMTGDPFCSPIFQTSTPTSSQTSVKV